MLARKKRTCLDGLSVNLRSVRGEAHWPVPKEAGCFYLELYFIQANKTRRSAPPLRQKFPSTSQKPPSPKTYSNCKKTARSSASKSTRTRPSRIPSRST